MSDTVKKERIFKKEESKADLKVVITVNNFSETVKYM